MILAEKIMKLRKKNGWSQEELAARLGISRQSVSKWESTASIPDLDKIIRLSELFGVSTDYLLKDELEEEAESMSLCDEKPEGTEGVRNVSLEEANAYMDIIDRVSKKIAAGVAACILSPVLLILLAGFAEYRVTDLTENMAAGIGVTILLLTIAGAVAVFIIYGMKLDKYDYMNTEMLSLQYGVAGIVEVKKESFEPLYKKNIALGVALCIISAVPIMIAMAFQAPEIVCVYSVDLLLALIAVAVFLFVRFGMVYGSYQKLLEEGEYSRENKLENKRNSNLATIYWCTVTAIYLGYSFYTGRWGSSWIIWPSAGVLFAAVCAAAEMIRKR